ncbi:MULTISPECIES: ribosome small subunit-dependent GTPase A [unclassified Thioalkalivibrio]|jgi:ribosome biogenesis GTPase|uniref:ribosome small subunit-dependent GTPase A n=1 Tax=unclassified Thioalkalivibrio TaxID=2621013 RepID=UPI0001959333|nr:MULTISPECIES: ribosome small subunit-dependent GTPase A [unclassified Thioalkalivibrio]
MADIAAPEDAEPRRIRLHRRQKDLACGDRVEMDAAGEQIQRRLPRDNTLVRQDGFGRRKVIAANIDTVWIVIAPSPMPARYLIDRFLVAVYNLPARPRILVNKQDAGPAAPSDWLAPYAHLDLDPLHVSARSGYGLDALAEAARGHTNILIGQSGVGKSSLIAALLERHGSGDIKLPETGDLAASGEGRHTTVTAQWYSLTGGGAWIDSPGVRDFTPELESIDALVRGFPDIEALGEGCRFRNCRHQTEPGCAVREGVDQGTLPAARLEAWTALLGTLEKR